MPILERKSLITREMADILREAVDNGNSLPLESLFFTAREMEFRKGAKEKPKGPFLQFSLLLVSEDWKKIAVMERSKLDLEEKKRRGAGYSLLINDNPKTDIREILLNSFDLDISAFSKIFEPKINFFGAGYTNTDKAEYYFIIFYYIVPKKKLKELEKSLELASYKDRFLGFLPFRGFYSKFYWAVHFWDKNPIKEIIKQQIGRCDECLAKLLLKPDLLSQKNVEESPQKTACCREYDPKNVLYGDGALSDLATWKTENGILVDMQGIEMIEDSFNHALTIGVDFDKIFAVYLREATILIEKHHFLSAQFFAGAASERMVIQLAYSLAEYFSQKNPLEEQKIKNLRKNLRESKVFFILKILREADILSQITKLADCEQPNVENMLHELDQIRSHRNHVGHPGEDFSELRPGQLIEMLINLKKNYYPLCRVIICNALWLSLPEHSETFAEFPNLQRIVKDIVSSISQILKSTNNFFTHTLNIEARYGDQLAQYHQQLKLIISCAEKNLHISTFDNKETENAIEELAKQPKEELLSYLKKLKQITSALLEYRR